ncbi:MAG TPA: universal stress protein [Natronoarchaeum rubrum]|nr:universal stress protein [Natronoarchaeum rubrum]
MASTVAGERLRPTDEYTVLVAVGNPGTAEQLTRTAVDLARANDGRVHVVSVIHKHHTSPFLLFSDDRIKQEFSGGRDEIVERAARVADDAGVPVDDSLLVGSDVARAITTAIGRLDADLAILGWRSERRASDVVLGTTIDPVVRKAPCDVLVEKVGTTADRVESVLVPTVGGAHAELAAEVAGTIAAANDASVTALSLVDPGATERERTDAATFVDETADALAGTAPVTTTVREAAAPAAGILEAAADHDLVVLGATRKGLLTRQIVGTTPRAVGTRADCPVIVASRRSQLSRVRRLVARIRR